MPWCRGCVVGFRHIVLIVSAERKLQQLTCSVNGKKTEIRVNF
jgi:hypothetical protein